MSPTLFNLYAEKIMLKAGMEESEVGVRVGGNIINNLRGSFIKDILAKTDFWRPDRV